MLKVTNSSSSAGASHAPNQATKTLSTLAPLAPLNLLQAGVPAREVIWFRHLRPDRAMAALRTTRGLLLLETVRAAQGNRAFAGMAA